MQQKNAELAGFQAPARAQEPKGRRFRTFRVVSALIMREIGSHDSRSSLGFLWAIIDPIATVVILSIAFGLITKTPPLGTNFPLYYITGIVPFHIYTSISGKVSGSVRFSRQLLGFPAVTVLDALFARFILNTMIEALVFTALSAGVIYFYDLRVNLDISSVLLGLSLAALLGLAVGTFNSVLFLMSPAYDNLWSMFSRPMVISSGALIMISDLPTWLFHILWWNPAAHVIALVRHGFFSYYEPTWVSIPYVMLFCGIAFVMGLITLQRYVYDALDK
ncbi:MAG: ABC transporter permease [Candidatus Saccharibacteria bacterium]|nr:ABC transporter permease [Pseudorhodobacter sp.]